MESRVKADGIFGGSTELQIEDSSKEPFFTEDEVPEVLCVSKCAQLEGG